MEKRRLLVLYGSQTGTSQDLAEQIWRESKKYNLFGPVLAMDDYDIKKLIEEKLVIFVCSTTGQGDEPDNMKKFWKFLLRKSLPTDSLSEMYFAVLGLGDSSYAQFNFAAKKLYKRLVQLSAKPLLQLGLCDDQHDLGPSAVYMNWIENLWNKLREVYPELRDNGIVSHFKYDLEVIEEQEEINMKALLQPAKDNVFEIEVKKNVRTTEIDHFQDVRLIEFKIADEDYIDLTKAKWDIGDVLVVKPSNSVDKVNKLFGLLEEHNLGFSAKTVVRLRQRDKEMPLPVFYQQSLPLELVATYIWDLNAIPRQRTFELLALNCDDELEKEKLIEFTLPSGLEDLYSYASRPRRTTLEVLYDFPKSVSKLTLPVVFELFQTIQPRSFSIASTPRLLQMIHILVAVVEYKTLLYETRKGLCSNWLKDLKVGDKIFGSTKKGTMKIPKDLDIPIIMVGPGTGVAPFRGLLMDRECTDSILAELVLFFGCRSQFKDFHCKDDFIRMQKKGLVKCFFAFSRDQDYKIYVQHIIEENKQLLKHLIIDENAVILVAGNAKNMPSAVKQAFVEVVGNNDLIEKMVKQGRYQEETWS